MDPITALSLACNVLAVTQTAISVAKRCKDLSENTGSIEDVLHYTQNIKSASLRLQDTLNKANKQAGVGPKDIELQRLANETVEVSDELVKVIKDSQPRDPASMRSRAHSKVKSLRNLNRIKNLQEKLERYERVIDTQQLSRLSQQSDEGLEMLAKSLASIDLVSLKQNESFSSLQTASQNMIQRLIDLQSTVEKQVEKNHNAIVSLQTDNEQRFTRKQVLDSLYSPALAARQASIREPHPSTCVWIFNEDEEQDWDNFAEWLKGGQGLYWISGILGSGKSTLMNFILHDSRTESCLRSWAGGTKLLMLNFFFWRAGSDEQKTTQGLLRYLVYQILDSDWETFSTSLNIPRGSRPSWSDITLKQTLKNLIDSQNGKISFALFVDGLDEAVDEDTRELLNLLTQLYNKPNCKICASSRPERVYEVYFKDTSKLRVEHLNYDDISKYVNEKLDSDHRMGEFLTEDSRACSRLKDSLVRRAKGVFIWVHLAVQRMLDVLDQNRPLRDLFEALDLLPERMEEMYRHMLSKIPKADREASCWWFSLVTVYEESFSILRLLATEFSQQFTSPGFSDISNLRLKIESLVARVSSNCAGLLECSFTTCKRGCDYLDLQKSTSSNIKLRYEQTTKYGDVYEHDNSSRALLQHLEYYTTLQWVHRSARDFIDSDQCDTDLKSRISALRGPSAKAIFEAGFQLGKSGIMQSAISLLKFLSLAEQEFGEPQVEAVEAIECEIIHQEPRVMFDDLYSTKITDFEPTYRLTTYFTKSQQTPYVKDFTGIAVFCGLNMYAEEKLKPLSGTAALEKATYLLMLLVMKGFHASEKDISALMDYGVDPNAHAGSMKEIEWWYQPPRFSSIWSTYLSRIYYSKFYFNKQKRLATLDTTKLFVQAGADINAYVTDWYEEGIRDSHYMGAHLEHCHFTVRFSPLFLFRKLESHAEWDKVIAILEQRGAESFCELISFESFSAKTGRRREVKVRGEISKNLGLAWADWRMDPEDDEEKEMHLRVLIEKAYSTARPALESGESTTDMDIVSDDSLFSDQESDLESVA